MNCLRSSPFTIPGHGQKDDFSSEKGEGPTCKIAAQGRSGCETEEDCGNKASQTGKAQAEKAEAAEVKALDACGSQGSVPALSEGQSRSARRARASEPFHAGGCCRAVGAGDRRRRQQG